MTDFAPLISSLHRQLNAFPNGRRAAEAFAADILEHYRQPHRHYHTLAHISALDGFIDTYRDGLRYPEVLQLAAWYHDVIYDPASTDNESASADYAELQLHTLGAEPALIRRIRALVLLTQKHDLQNEADTDAAFFLDIDLSVLGADPPEYLHYADHIRQEYSRYPDLLYKPSRRKVLRRFLDQRFIYRTPALRERWEDQARINLREELERLG